MSNALPLALGTSMHLLVLAKVECGELEWSQLKNRQCGDMGKLFITWPLQCLCHWKGKGNRGGECVAGAGRGLLFWWRCWLEPASRHLLKECLRSIQAGLKCIAEHCKKWVGIEQKVGWRKNTKNYIPSGQVLHIVSVCAAPGQF